MKPSRLFTIIAFAGFSISLAALKAWADWGPPMSEGWNAYGSQVNCAPPNNPGFASDPGYAAAMMAGANNNYMPFGEGGYGMPPMDYMPAGYGAPGCDSVACGGMMMPGGNPALGGMASGCRPVGLLSRLGSMRGLRNGASCGVNGYHPGAYPQPFGAGQEVVNPYESHPGIGAMGEFINMGDVCCGPHWYDVMVQAVFLQRDSDTNVGLTSEGPRGFGQPNIILSTSDLDTGLNTAMRVAGRLQLSAVNSFELVYLGGVDWSDSRTVFSQFNDLYSVYSDFGVNPLGGFEDTDQAARHSATFSSDLDSFEVNYRSEWVSENYRSSGAVLFGGRYIRLRDRFLFSTQVEQHLDDVTDPDNPVLFGPGASAYDVAARNDMLGLHAGGELTRCLFPGFTMGVEAKLGVYGNSTDQATSFNATTGLVQFNESRTATSVSYSTDAQLFFLWQIHPMAKLRGGYELLFLDGVATGPGNFNPVDVFVPRNPILNADEELLIHGFNLGVEFGW